MDPAVLLADALNEPCHVPIRQGTDEIDPSSNERVSYQIGTSFHGRYAPLTA
jgi:hypothetical protein